MPFSFPSFSLANLGQNLGFGQCAPDDVECQRRVQGQQALNYDSLNKASAAQYGLGIGEGGPIEDTEAMTYFDDPGQRAMSYQAGSPLTDMTADSGKVYGGLGQGQGGFNFKGMGKLGSGIASAFAEQDAENQARAQAVADQAMAEGMSMVGKPSANPGSMRQCNMFDMSGCEHKDMYRAGIFGA